MAEGNGKPHESPQARIQLRTAGRIVKEGDDGSRWSLIIHTIAEKSGGEVEVVAETTIKGLGYGPEVLKAVLPQVVEVARDLIAMKTAKIQPVPAMPPGLVKGS